MHKLLPLPLGHLAVKSHETEPVLFEERRDQVQHGGPLGKEDQLAAVFLRQLPQHFIELLQFARESGKVFVDQAGAVGSHPAHQQRFLQAQQIHFADEFLSDDRADDFHVGRMQFELLVRRRDANDFGGSGRELLHDRLARPPQQNRFEPLAQGIKVFVAEHLALFINQPVPIIEVERRAQAPVVDEFDHRKKVIQPILERCAGEHQGKSRFQAFDDPARFGFPVFDPLALVQDDQVPLDLFDGQDIAQNLFVIAEGEEPVIGILSGAQFHAADDLLAVAFGKTPDFRFPLRFERSRANHQYFANIDFPREKLSDAHPLDRFAQAHVVGQNRPSPAGGEGNPIQLVRQQFRLEQFFAERMCPGVGADGSDFGCDVLLEQLLLNVFLRVGIDLNGMRLLFELPNPAQQVFAVVDRPIFNRRHDGPGSVIQSGRKREPQFELFPVLQMNRDVFRHVRCLSPIQCQFRIGLRVESIVRLLRRGACKPA